jgi:hypothetical protein
MSDPMAVIQRFDLSTGGAIPDSTSVEMPMGATVLSAAFIGMRFCVYAMCPTSDEFNIHSQRRHFRILATDEVFEWNAGMQFVGTVRVTSDYQWAKAEACFHVFEETDA